MIRALMTVAAAVMLAAPVAAQQQQQQPPMRRGAAGGGGGNPQRPQLERMFQQEMARLVRQRLNLTDDQMTRLRAVDSRMEGRRAQLLRDENLARRELRMAMEDSTVADRDRKVGIALDRLIGIQRTRFDLAAAEQKELSTFLTNVQRARYHALQDQLRRRLDQLAQEGPPPGRGGAPGRRGGPPPPI